MENCEFMVYLRPKTGMNNGKMYCEMMKDYFVLTYKKWALLDSDGFYKIFYKDIERVEDKNYMFIKGIQIFFNNDNVQYPSSPSVVYDGLLGGIISYFKRKKCILYFDNQEEKDLFIEKCQEGNELIEYGN